MSDLTAGPAVYVLAGRLGAALFEVECGGEVGLRHCSASDISSFWSDDRHNILSTP